MRIIRTFAASSSGNSLLLGFLDVISCGFAAALVLGLILSIVRPPEAGLGAENKPYRYFEFTVSDNLGAAPRVGRPYVSPAIYYTAPGALVPVRTGLRLTEDAHWELAEQNVRVDFIGAVATENLIQTEKSEANTTCFGILVSELKKGAKIDIQLIYSTRSQPGAVAFSGGVITPIVVTRQVFGGDSKSAKQGSQPLQLGDATAFGIDSEER